jgi:hypothetical protein
MALEQRHASTTFGQVEGDTGAEGSGADDHGLG